MPDSQAASVAVIWLAAGAVGYLLAVLTMMLLTSGKGKRDGGLFS